MIWWRDCVFPAATGADGRHYPQRVTCVNRLRTRPCYSTISSLLVEVSTSQPEPVTTTVSSIRTPPRFAR